MRTWGLLIHVNMCIIFFWIRGWSKLRFIIIAFININELPCPCLSSRLNFSLPFSRFYCCPWWLTLCICSFNKFSVLCLFLFNWCNSSDPLIATIFEDIRNLLLNWVSWFVLFFCFSLELNLTNTRSLILSWRSLLLIFEHFR